MVLFTIVIVVLEFVVYVELARKPHFTCIMLNF